MDIQEIMKILPHRPPFLLLDRVTDLEPGERITAIKNVTINEPFFVGHFPAEPIMPGVLILEAIAQAGAVAILCMDEFKGKIAFLGGMEKVRFRRKVVPGDVLRLEAVILKRRGKAGSGKGIAYVGEEKAAEAEFTFLIGE